MSTITPVQINIQKPQKLTCSTRTSNWILRDLTSKSIINSNQDLLLKYSNPNPFLIFNDKASQISINSMIKLKRLVNESKDHKNKEMNKSLFITHEHLINTITSNRKSKITYSLMHDFAIHPLPRSIPFVSNIAIKIDSLFEQLYPWFILSVNSNERQILMAKKELKLASIVYKIYCNDDNEQCCIGKVKSNFLGNEFKIYERIHSHHLQNKQRQNKNKKKKKKLIGIIKFDCKGLIIRHEPRNMIVFLPKKLNSVFSRSNKPNITSIVEGGRILKTASNNKFMNLVDCHTTDEKADDDKEGEAKESNSHMMVLQNKKPIWSRSKLILMVILMLLFILGLSSYQLDFKGRVERVSNRNFILQLKDQDILRFGKIDHNYYAMDFQYPLSPLQAFGICLSTLAPKLFCD